MHAKWRLAVALALAGCATAFAPALTCPARGGAAWHEVDSAHFVLFTDLPPDEAQETQAAFERIVDLFETVLFPSSNPPTTRVRIVLFRRERDFAPFAPVTIANAFFGEDGDIESRPVVVMHGELTRDVRRIFQHELTHRFLRHFVPVGIPAWFHEGLAGYFSTARITDDKATLGEPVRQYLQASNLPSLHALLTDDGSAFRDKEHADAFYVGGASPADPQRWKPVDDAIHALARRAQSPSALNFVGWYFAERHDPGPGIPFGRRAVDKDPQANYLDTLALLLFENGQLGDALALQERAVSALDDGARGGDLRARLRKYREAAAAASH